jgi:hypothetical protein
MVSERVHNQYYNVTLSILVINLHENIQKVLKYSTLIVQFLKTSPYNEEKFHFRLDIYN